MPEVRQQQQETVITMRALLEAGVHFGHQTKRWNPKMQPYIYGARNGVHIIDLQKTLPLFVQAYNKVMESVSHGYGVLFVGTKKQAQDVFREEAARCGMHSVTSRWLGGTLTNWKTVKSSIEKMKSLEARTTDALNPERLTKKELLTMTRTRGKLERNLLGIKNMQSLPGVVFVVDPKKEKIAVAEANKLGIPVIAITDTNCDPDVVDYVIPANDDAIRAVKLFAEKIADACLAGQKMAKERAISVRDKDIKDEANASDEPIRVASGGDGPKVEVVSRRTGARPEPEAVASPDENGK